MLDADAIRQLTDTIRAYGELFAAGLLVFGAIISGIIALFVKSRMSLNKAHADLAVSQKELAEQQKQGARDLPAQLTAVGDNMAAKVVDAFSPIIKRQDETITTLTGRLEKLESKSVQDEKDKQMLQGQIDSQCALLDKQTQKIDALQQSLTQKNIELETANQTIEKQVAQLRELETLKEQVQSLSAEVERLKAKLIMQDKLQAELAAAQETIRAKDAEITRLTGELSTAETALAAAEAELIAERQKSARADNSTDTPDLILTAARADNPPKPPEAVA